VARITGLPEMTQLQVRKDFTMKRNWLIYVAIVAALLAGAVCSTAFAENKGKSRFRSSSSSSSSSSTRSLGGGNSLSRVKSMQSNGGSFQQFQSQGGSGISSSLKKVQVQQGNGGLSQIRTMPGSINKIDPKFSQGLGANSGLTQIGQNPQVILNQGLAGKIKPANVGGSSPTLPALNKDLLTKLKPALGNGQGNLQLNPNAIQNLPPGLGIGNGNGQGGLQLNPNAIQNLPPGLAGIGSGNGNGQGGLQLNPNAIQPLPPGLIGSGNGNGNPICNPCHNPHNHWCGPCWWWTPSFCNPCYTGCYYPTIYTYPQTIVVTQPVTTVVAADAVAPAVAVEPVAEKLMQIPIGSTITLAGKDLGDAAGQVVVQIDKISLPAQLNEWKADSVNVTLPMLGLAGPTKAQLWMVKADGAVAANMAVELIPAKPEAPAATATAMP
jgi:hypothetical protein